MNLRSEIQDISGGGVWHLINIVVHAFLAVGKKKRQMLGNELHEKEEQIEKKKGRKVREKMRRRRKRRRRVWNLAPGKVL